MEIRRALADDLLEVAAIEEESFAHAWTLQGFADALCNVQTEFLVAVGDDGGTQKIFGYALLYLAADEGEIPTIAVAKKYRRQGVGNALLQRLFALGQGYGAGQIYLEVRQSNLPARRLYEANGFYQVGVRPRFYENPEEDADLMVKKLPVPDDGAKQEDVC